MPDRDYYLKPDQRFVEARAKYLEHVAKMFVLAGASADEAKKNAQTVFEFEKRLAEASLDNVAAARSQAAGPHDRVRRPGQARAELRLGGSTSTPRACRAMRST